MAKAALGQEKPATQKKPATRQDLDAAINELRRAQRVTLDSADGRHERLGAEEIAAAIVEDGNRLVYMARRQR